MVGKIVNQENMEQKGRGEISNFLTKTRYVFSSLLLSMCLFTTAGHAGELYAINDDPSFPLQNPLISIDINTFAVTTIGDLGIPFTSGGLAYDPNSDILYLVDGRSGTTGVDGLYTVDRSTGVGTLIGIHGVSDLLGLAFDSRNNILYASTFPLLTGAAAGELYRLDTSTGAATLVGATMGFSGLAYDAFRDRLIGIAGSAIHEIDRSNGDPGAAIASFPIDGIRHGLAYDSDLDKYWDSNDQGDLYSYDPFFASFTQHIFGSAMPPRLDSLTYVATPIVEPISIDITRVKVKFDADAGGVDEVHVRGHFTLGLGNNGIDPLNEEVVATVGTATLVIPAGSFIPTGSKYLFEGHVGSSEVKMKIGGNSGEIAFSLKAKGLDLTDTSNPVSVELQIGDDAGETLVRMHGNLKYEESD